MVATPLAEAIHKQNIQRYKKDIKLIDFEIWKLIDPDPGFGEIISLLMSIPGVGLLQAANIILIIQTSPETIHNLKIIASCIGLCPNEHRSGTSIYKPASKSYCRTEESSQVASPGFDVGT